MKLLNDGELICLVTRPERPIVTGLPEQLVNSQGLHADWFSKDGSVQPASIDLHVGEIYVPETESGQLGSYANPINAGHKLYDLKVGRTAVVKTQEAVDLPANIAAFGFPPSSISSRGILMTNPGHVDPGFKGHLNFTVINMGRVDFPLKIGDPIVTMLLVELSRDAQRDYTKRRTGVSRDGMIADQVNKLTADFLAVEKRAEKIAKEVADESVKKVNWRVGLASATIAALVTLVGYFQSASSREVRKDFEVLKTELKVSEFKDRLEKLEERVKSKSSNAAAP